MILLVDDEPDLATTCRRLLRRQGYGVLTCGTRQAGLTALSGGAPRLIISDVRLPDGDGLDVVRAARAQTPPVPSIVITGRPSNVGRDAALAAGASAYLAKPFTAAAFVTLVQQVLGQLSD